MAKLIFIGGIHGVGKTTLCKLINETSRIPHYSASELISKQTKSSLTSKLVKNINSNQDALVSAIDSVSVDSEYYLLDGHYCLLDSENNVARIPVSTFSSIAPVAIIIITAKCEDIARRLSERDGQDYSLGLIENFQKQEQAYFEELKRELDVPNFMATAETPNKNIVNFITEVKNKG